MGITWRTDLEIDTLNDRRAYYDYKTPIRWVEGIMKRITNDLFSHCHLLHQISSLVIPYALPGWCSNTFKIIDTELNIQVTLALSNRWTRITTRIWPLFLSQCMVSSSALSNQNFTHQKEYYWYLFILYFSPNSGRIAKCRTACA